MKIIIDKKKILKTLRRTWKINPATKVIKNKRRYSRNRMKRLTKKEINEDLSRDEGEHQSNILFSASYSLRVTTN